MRTDQSGTRAQLAEIDIPTRQRPPQAAPVAVAKPPDCCVAAALLAAFVSCRRQALQPCQHNHAVVCGCRPRASAAATAAIKLLQSHGGSARCNMQQLMQLVCCETIGATGVSVVLHSLVSYQRLGHVRWGRLCFQLLFCCPLMPPLVRYCTGGLAFTV